MNYTSEKFSSFGLFESKKVEPKTFYKTFKANTYDEVKEQFKIFAENIYHVLRHDLEKIGNNYVLTIEYI